MAKYFVTGVEDVDKALREFLPKAANKMYRSSLRKAGKLVSQQAQGNLEKNKSVDTGKLRKAIKVRAFRNVYKTGQFKTLGSGKSVAIKKADVGVQVLTLGGGHKDKEFAGAQVELGRPRTAPFEPKPFLRPALYDNQTQIREMIVADIREQIAITKANNIK